MKLTPCAQLSSRSLGLDKIEFLQNHENREIYQKAFDIIERYFGTDEEDAALAPAVDAQAQQFRFDVNTESNAAAAGDSFQFWRHYTTTACSLYNATSFVI